MVKESNEVEKDYMIRKAKLKELHKRLSNPQTKKVQEIYHKIMDSENKK